MNKLRRGRHKKENHGELGHQRSPLQTTMQIGAEWQPRAQIGAENWERDHQKIEIHEVEVAAES